MSEIESTTFEITENVYEENDPVSETEESRYKNDTFYLKFSAFAVNLLAISYGITYSWTSSAFPKLQSTEQPFSEPVSTIQLSLISSLTDITQIFGLLIEVYLSEKFGRKMTYFWTSILYVVANIMLGLASTVWLYYVARLMQGLANGMTILLPTYISEIAESHNSGKYTVYYITSLNVGVLYSYTIGAFVSLKCLNFGCAFPALLYLILWRFTPESPVYLLKHGKTDKVQTVLKALRKKNPVSINKDIKILEKQMISGNKKVKNLSVLKSKSFKKSLVLASCLLSSQPLLGIMTIIAFSQQVFDATESAFASEYCSIITGIFLVIVTFIVAVFVERKFKRKTLMLLGTSGLTITLFLITGFFFLKRYVPESLEYTFWMPLTYYFAYFTFLQCFGPLTWVVGNELFSTEAKSLGMSISSILFLLAIFLATFLFPILSKAWGIAEVFLIHTSFSALTFLFVFFFIPETKERDYFEVQNIMSKSSWLIREKNKVTDS